MSSTQGIKFRTNQKRLRTQSYSVDIKNKNKKHNEFKQQQEDRFHLQEHVATHKAKHELQKISQIHNNDFQQLGQPCFINQVTVGWESEPQNWLHHVKKPSSMTKLRTSIQNKVKHKKSQNTSCYFFLNERRQRSKTETDYHVNISQKLKKNEVSHDITKLIQLTNEKKKQKQLSKVSCFSPVVTVIPQVNESKLRNTIKNNRGGKSALSTTFIQISLGGKTKLLKNTTHAKNQYQRNLYYRKANNTTLLHKKVSQENSINSMKNPQNQVKDKNSSSLNLHSLLKKALRKPSNESVNEENTIIHPNTPSIKTSPLRQELQKLKRLLYGEQYNYLELGEKCPMKIFGLTNAQQ